MKTIQKLFRFAQMLRLVFACSLTLVCLACSEGGQTGEWSPPDVCGGKLTQVPARKLYTLRLDQRIPGLDVTPNEVFAAYTQRTFDEIKYVPYRPNTNWTPDLIASTTCNAGTVKIVPKPGGIARVYLHDSASEDCPNEIVIEAQASVSSLNGDLAEVLPADVVAYLVSPEAKEAHHIYFRAEQEIGDMKGNGRPEATNAMTFVVEEIQSAVRLGFTIPPASKEGGGEAGGTERFAVWDHVCANSDD